MKKKHLQFNDITAPSLARRAARRGAEKGESGRMEPGVINVFFLLPCKKQHQILLILFRALSFPISSCSSVLLPILSSFLLEYNYLLFYSENVPSPAILPSPMCNSLRVSELKMQQHWPWVLPVSVSVSPHTPPSILSIFIKGQKMLGTIKQIKSQCSWLSEDQQYAMTWRESHLGVWISLALNDPFILWETQWFPSFLPAGCQAAALL